MKSQEMLMSQWISGQKNPGFWAAVSPAGRALMACLMLLDHGNH